MFVTGKLIFENLILLLPHWLFLPGSSEMAVSLKTVRSHYSVLVSHALRVDGRSDTSSTTSRHGGVGEPPPSDHIVE